MQDTHCIYNGHLVSIYEPAIPFANRAFRYGDALFESIRLCNGKIMFIRDHVVRLKLGMTVLRMNVPAEFKTENIIALIEQLCEKNKVGSDARIRLTVFRNDGGFYVPDTNDISFLIEADKIEAPGYILNQKGLWADVYADIKKPINKLSNIKSSNALLYVMAGLAKTSMKLDDCFLINEHSHICESISANIFVVKNGSLTTAPLTEGCVDGVMRKQIFRIAAANKILIFEQPMTINTVMNGDEVFLTNSSRGIQWVGQFKNKFFTNQRAVYFTEKLNELSKQQELV